MFFSYPGRINDTLSLMEVECGRVPNNNLVIVVLAVAPFFVCHGVGNVNDSYFTVSDNTHTYTINYTYCRPIGCRRSVRFSAWGNIQVD